MFITHDLGVIAEMADYVVVMYAGRIVEQGTAEEIFAHPAHPYTIGLMASKPVVGKQVDKLYSIPGKVPNPINMPNYCYFKDRCEMCVNGCEGAYPHEISLTPTHKVSCYRILTPEQHERRRANRLWTDHNKDNPFEDPNFTPVEYDPQYILQVNHLKKYFPIKSGMISHTVGYVKAVDGVTFNLKRGTTMGLVGESGCGKTTTGRTILRLYDT